MRRCIFILLSLMTYVMALSEKPVNVSAEYIFYPPSSMSIDEAKKVAVERARLQALADQFGTRISQTTNTLISNHADESSVDFFSSGVNEVLGQWIEDTASPEVKIEYVDDVLIVRAYVKGKARSVSTTLIPLVAKVLRNGIDEKNESDSFIDGDSLYLLFQAPVNGSLIVYLIDHAEKQVFCLLPYASSDFASFAINRDTLYLLFSDDICSSGADDIDQYVLTCKGNNPEYNEILILFSTSDLVKSNTIRTSLNQPRQMSYHDFNCWLSKLKNVDSNLQIIQKPITVKPNQL